MSPPILPNKVLSFLRETKSGLPKLNNSHEHYCPVCSSTVEKFSRLPDIYYEKLDAHGFMFSIFQFETLNQLGYLCPHCGSSDRDRLYAIYLISKFPGEFKGQHFLDIAPSNSLRTFIRQKYSELEYRSADLERKDVDDRVDITHMNIYQDGFFDFFICSHVLEHIQDDNKALQELYRVLNEQGRGILMVPIMLTLEEDYENSEITDPGERWKHFGQDDHVRMYSKKGFLRKIKSAGFQVSELGINFFGEDTFSRYGIHPRSVLYIVSKQKSTDVSVMALGA
jgi:SAM-dependent methyltransferase